MDVVESVHKTILKLFKQYLICGGLPESVNEFVINRNVSNTRKIQTRIYNYYKDDASQYDLEHNLKIRLIYDFLPSYMGNKVKRIQYKSIKSNVRASLIKYEDEFNYLIDSGCSLPSKAILNPKFPLMESMSKNLIKLYYNDVGILTNLLFKNNIQAILNNDKGINLGSIYETVCAMELIAHEHNLFYFDTKKVGEVDFIINNYNSLSCLPIEIKSGNDKNNFRAIPKLVKEPYKLKEGYVLSNDSKIIKKDNLIYYPVYMIMFI